MIITQGEIEEGFRNAGLGLDDIVLVHSSLSSFGYVKGGANAVINAFLKVVGPDGTVIVPTLTGKYTDSKENAPIFDVRSTPCWTGEIPETFRNIPDAKRSLHPTHSVAAIGGKRDIIISSHQNGESPCDKKSPYYKNAMLGGYIMLIGVDQECNTSIHCCEEVAGVPYHLQHDVTETFITGYIGDKILIKNRLHDWYKPPTDFNKFDELFKSYGIMMIFKIGNSVIRLIKAKDMLEFAVDMLTRNPDFLIK